jgi:hypothetical protein
MKVIEAIKKLLEYPMDYDVVLAINDPDRDHLCFIDGSRDIKTVTLFGDEYNAKLAKFAAACNGCTNLYYLRACNWNVDRAILEYHARQEPKYGRRS